MPVYDLSSRQDRLTLALSLVSRKARISLAELIRRRYGEEARKELVEDLKREFQTARQS